MTNRTPIGIVLNGLTGRMGLRQHLIRSVVAIREAGGPAAERRSRATASAPRWPSPTRCSCHPAPR
jgi:hypothetical protein